MKIKKYFRENWKLLLVIGVLLVISIGACFLAIHFGMEVSEVKHELALKQQSLVSVTKALAEERRTVEIYERCINQINSGTANFDFSFLPDNTLQIDITCN